MKQDRRTFLKTTALAGAAAAGAGALATPALAQRTAAPHHRLAADAEGLRVRDAAAAGRLWPRRAHRPRHSRRRPRRRQEFRENAPTTIDAVFKGQGDISGLKRLIDRASASLADRYFVAIDKASFGPA